MKTTIEISDALFEEAKKIAARDGTTIRALVEQGLRHAVNERRRRGRFKLRRASFMGRGLQPGIEDLGWGRIRDLAYQGRGT